MENWIQFPLFAICSAILWLSGLILISIGYFRKEKKKIHNIGIIVSVLGIIVFGSFIALLWLKLQHPPLQTLGETRLWTSFFLVSAGLIIYLRWKFILMYVYSVMQAFVFLIINLTNPEIHERVLMPALQSPWFVPHVVVYMLAYALLGLSCAASIYGLAVMNTKRHDEKISVMGDNLVYLGFAFLTCGLLFGAIWAKEAWGHYWTWDPKETWAFLTWLAYLIYLHIRYYHSEKVKMHMWILSLSFIVLLVCWFGINYLPSAQNSIHVYSN